MKTRALQLGRYGIAGCIATASHYFLFGTLMASTGLNTVVATTVGAGAGAIVGFAVNTRWAFSESRAGFQGFGKFCVVAAMALVGNALILEGLTSDWHLSLWTAQVCATIVVFILTFELNRNWSFACLPGDRQSN